MYKGLSRAQLSYDYLHTNSTTHEFLFGALAELLDNARDASATKINIYSVPDAALRGEYMLCFLDDGQGMSPDEASDIITFGKSTKKSLDSQLIGMYGNGLKSGSMRIGNDFILFTKKGPTVTCVFLSRTFHELEQLDEIIVPMPSFDSQTKKPIAKTPREKEKHLIEMELILKYSPFKTEAQFLKEFDKIEGSSGSLVIIYNLKLLDSGQPELDVKTDPTDIILTNPEHDDLDSDEGLMPERKSFRAYTSILYVEPRMRVYIQGKKVRTKRLVNTLYKPHQYRYSSARFRARAEAEAKRAEEDAKSSENRAREAESKAKSLELKIGNSVEKEQRAELRRAQTAAMELRKEAQLRKAMAERKSKSLRDPKTLVFVFGFNIDNRSRDGMFVYNCSRLIKMYQKVGPQFDGGPGNKVCVKRRKGLQANLLHDGITSGNLLVIDKEMLFVLVAGLGVVDVPYLVLEPTHNKQDFADAKEYRHLQQAMGEHMTQYWRDMEIAQKGVQKFWEDFGYISPNWRDLPSSDPKFVRKRAAQVSMSLQCDLCLKWRILPYSFNNIGKVFPDDWVCSMNPDPAHNRCSSSEAKLNLPESVLKKTSKSSQQKEKDLAEEIKKKQILLEKMQKSKGVSSSSKSGGRRDSDSESDVRDQSNDEEEEEDNDDDSERRGRHTVLKSGAVYGSGSKGSAVKRTHRAGESSEEERRDDDDDDDWGLGERKAKQKTVTTPPAKKKAMQKSYELERRLMSALKQTAGGSSHKASSSSSSAPMKRIPRHSDALPPTRSRHPPSDEEEDKEEEVDDDDDDNEYYRPRNIAIGMRVKTLLNNKWVSGHIMEISKVKQKWRVKTDHLTNDKYDRWHPFDSRAVRFIRPIKSRDSVGEVAEPKKLRSISVNTDQTGNQLVGPIEAGIQTVGRVGGGGDQGGEAPTSSSGGGGAAATLPAAVVEEIANGYRTCLRYFLPPQWIMDKEAVSVLGMHELSGFPLDDFFDQYEKGLRKLVSSFQADAQTKQTEAEIATSKLANVRKMIAKLLKTINEEFEIEPECDTDQVDDLLSLCLKQALAHAKSSANPSTSDDQGE